MVVLYEEFDVGYEVGCQCCDGEWKQEFVMIGRGEVYMNYGGVGVNCFVQVGICLCGGFGQYNLVIVMQQGVYSDQVESQKFLDVVGNVEQGLFVLECCINLVQD